MLHFEFTVLSHLNCFFWLQSWWTKTYGTDTHRDEWTRGERQNDKIKMPLHVEDFWTIQWTVHYNRKSYTAIKLIFLNENEQKDLPLNDYTSATSNSCFSTVSKIKVFTEDSLVWITVVRYECFLWLYLDQHKFKWHHIIRFPTGERCEMESTYI